MKRCRKVYGIDNFAEKQISINVGKSIVNVHFTNGGANGHGTTPARFTTSTPFYQHVIENCSFFKRGGIKLLATYEIEGEDEDVNEQVETDEERAQRMEKVRAAKDATIETKFGTKEHGNAVIVEVTCIEDAKQHLMENYGYTVRSLKDTKGIIEAAKASNILFKGCKDLEE